MTRQLMRTSTQKADIRRRQSERSNGRDFFRFQYEERAAAADCRCTCRPVREPSI
jgi:hypothetical protein